ncbi:ligase-associated DNA damage response endonuclease PdeM [Frigidibacter sp. RF13]|uniref:ligase-associated DNA damage response endonuclease PdeM n=1 Tax=Frigidibacter sp. RF13 TaxID=2997340 RepID=UPI002D1E3B98|nr:ligase-associated DNA damage response endonuclease PdeM [Frigidibacter sp. RF13]
MGGFDFDLQGVRLTALPSGALFWSAEALLVVSDLHLGRSERYARRGGALIPPYETVDTLARLDADLDRTGARTAICLGDSFDDLAASALPEADALWLARMKAGRRWIWIAGNHDPGPVDLGGEHLAELAIGPLTFRHIALPGATGEVSGHYHPKVRLAGQARPAFLTDHARVILPAYGTYTGGMAAETPELRALFAERALAVLTGQVARPVPF